MIAQHQQRAAVAHAVEATVAVVGVQWRVVSANTLRRAGTAPAVCASAGALSRPALRSITIIVCLIMFRSTNATGETSRANCLAAGKLPNKAFLHRYERSAMSWANRLNAARSHAPKIATACGAIGMLG